MNKVVDLTFFNRAIEPVIKQNFRINNLRLIEVVRGFSKNTNLINGEDI